MSDFFNPKGIKPYPLEEIDWFFSSFTPFPLDKIYKRLKNGEAEKARAPIAHVIDILEEESSKDYMQSGVFREMPAEYIRDISMNLFVFSCWEKYKQIYRFDKTLYNTLTQDTLDGNVPARIILERLPFESFFIENPIQDDTGFEYRGVYVIMMNGDTGKELLLYYVAQTPERDYRFCYVPLGVGEMTLEELMNTRNRHYNIPPKAIAASNSYYEQNVLLTKKILNLIVYLCSEEQDTEKVVIRVPKGKKKETKVRKTYVGKKLGRTIYETKKRYVYDEKGAIGLGKGTPKAPHLRKAHYHSFWTGKKDKPEERKLVVKFVAPTYVNGEERENIETTTRKIK